MSEWQQSAVIVLVNSSCSATVELTTEHINMHFQLQQSTYNLGLGLYMLSVCASVASHEQTSTRNTHRQHLIETAVTTRCCIELFFSANHDRVRCAQYRSDRLRLRVFLLIYALIWRRFDAFVDQYFA
jgi:hypothetical protein